MSTLITALVLIGFIALVVGILMFAHRRDPRAEAANNEEKHRFETIGLYGKA